MRVNDVLKQPKVTEKALGMANMGKYTFIVNPRATRDDVKYAIKEIYNVDAVNIHIINTFGGKKRDMKDRRRFKYVGKVKKAIVKLSEGQKIDIYDMKENA